MNKIISSTLFLLIASMLFLSSCNSKEKTFSINGEELHMNKTGVYELSYPGLDIYHIAVVSSKYAAENGIEPFILNYTYTIS